MDSSSTAPEGRSAVDVDAGAAVAVDAAEPPPGGRGGRTSWCRPTSRCSWTPGRVGAAPPAAALAAAADVGTGRSFTSTWPGRKAGRRGRRRASLDSCAASAAAATAASASRQPGETRVGQVGQVRWWMSEAGGGRAAGKAAGQACKAARAWQREPDWQQWRQLCRHGCAATGLAASLAGEAQGSSHASCSPSTRLRAGPGLGFAPPAVASHGGPLASSWRHVRACCDVNGHQNRVLRGGRVVCLLSVPVWQNGRQRELENVVGVEAMPATRWGRCSRPRTGAPAACRHLYPHSRQRDAAAACSRTGRRQPPSTLLMPDVALHSKEAATHTIWVVDVGVCGCSVDLHHSEAVGGRCRPPRS